MNKHVRRAWRHYDAIPLVYVETRFSHASIYRVRPESIYPDVLASIWSTPPTAAIITPRHYRLSRQRGDE